MLAALLAGFGINATWAAEQEATVKMTYVNGSATTESYGSVTTAQTGYNKISGGAVNLANAGWGANNVVFLQVDASAVAGDIKKVTLSMEASGSTDSKRTAGIGVGYNASAWSETLTWETADRSITELGGQLWTSSKSATQFEAMSFDITEAFTDDADKVVTILVYNTQAAGNNIQNVKAVVEYAKADEVLVNYSFDDAENPVLVADGSNGNRGTANYDYDSPISTGKFLNVWGENNNNGFKVATITSADVTSNGQWTLEFDWAGYSGCNGKAGQTKLVDLDGNSFFTIDDAAGWGNTFSLSTGGTVACYPCNKETRWSANTGSVLSAEYWHHFTFIGTKNGVSVTIEQYGLDEGGNVTKTVVAKNVKVSTANVTPASIGLRPGSCGSVAIDNLMLTVGDLKIVEYAYTVKFVTEGDIEFKDAETRTDVEGAVLAVTDDDKATITEGKTQYIYLSDDAAEQTLDGEGQVITITYQKLTVANYTVNYIDANGTDLKDATIHQNVEVGTEVSATAGEKAQLLVENTLYNFVSGDEVLTVGEDETANVINLVFAPVEGVEAYYLQNYETGAADFTTSTGGRYDVILANGAGVADRDVQFTHVDTIATAVVDSLGEAVVDSLGNPVYTYTYNTVVDSTKTIVFANKTQFLTVNQASRNNNGATLTGNAISVDAENFTFEAKLLLGSSNDQAGTTFTLFNQAGDAAILKLQQNGKSSTSWKVNDDAEDLLELPNSGTATGTTFDNLNYLSWYNFKVTVFKGYTFLTVTDAEGNAIVEQKQIATLANTYGVGKMTFASSRYYANFAIDDILVRNVLDEDKPEGFNPTAVTISFVDTEGESVKESETIELNAGDEIVLRDIYKESFKVGHWNVETTQVEVGTDSVSGEPIYEEQSDSTWVDDLKYIYVSDDAAGKVALADEVVNVNVVFKAGLSCKVNIRFKTVVDGKSTNLKENYVTFENAFEGDVLTYYYPKYRMIDGVLYTTDEAGSYPFSATYTVPEVVPMSNGMIAAKLAYIDLAPATELTDVVYYMEAEEIPGLNADEDDYTHARYSGGKGGWTNDSLTITQVPAGIYKIVAVTRNKATYKFYAGEQFLMDVVSEGALNTYSADFTATVPTDINLKGLNAAAGKSFDYVYIQKVGDIIISDVALEAASEFDSEDGSMQIAVLYTPNIPEEYAEDYLDAVFTGVVYNAEGEVVETFEKNPLEITDGTFNVYLSGLDVNTEYTVVVNGVNVIDYSLMDEETFEFPTIYAFDGEMARLTFVTPEENPAVGIAAVDAAKAVKADGKYLLKGKVVILKGGKTYSTNGVELK